MGAPVGDDKVSSTSAPGSGAGSASQLDVRFVGSINGAYTLASRRGQTGKVEVFACRVLSISPMSVAVTAPVAGEVNERLTAKIDDVGIVAGHVARLIPGGFVFDVDASPQEREAIAARVRWLKREHVNADHNKREHKRTLPRDARSTITLPDGSVLNALLIDISRSGAALSADLTPAVGDAMVVGSLPAKVVRPLKVGFAVQFDEVQDAAGLEKSLLPKTPAEPVPDTGT